MGRPDGLEEPGWFVGPMAPGGSAALVRPAQTYAPNGPRRFAEPSALPRLGLLVGSDAFVELDRWVELIRRARLSGP